MMDVIRPIGVRQFGYRQGHTYLPTESIVTENSIQNVNRKKPDGDDSGTDFRVWKVAPGEHAWMWDECRDAKCITINWLNHVDFNDFPDKDAITRMLSKNKSHLGRKGAPFIWYFVHDIQPGHVVVANNGLSCVEGIGVIKSKYLPPGHPKNPRGTFGKHRHARLVEWLVTTAVELPPKLFTRPTVQELDVDQCSIIKRAYLRYDPALKPQFARLFPDDYLSEVDEDIDAIKKDRTIPPTTKKALIAARRGQGKFRTSVLKQWGQRCAVTSSVTDQAIKASHIKPWRESTNEQRLDAENGLPLIANLDALFDKGLISFNSSGRMIVSPKLLGDERKLFGVEETSLVRPPTAKMETYLAHHRRDNGFEE